MGENGPLTETAMLFEDEEEDVDKLDPEEEDEDKIAHFHKDDGIISGPSSSTGRVYDRTTVLIEQDPIRLDEDGEEDGMGFLQDGEGDGDEGSLAFMSDPDGMSQGYIHHTISPDQIQFIINPGSTPMPRNIEGATLTLHSECPETKLREVGYIFITCCILRNKKPSWSDSLALPANTIISGQRKCHHMARRLAKLKYLFEADSYFKSNYF